MPPAFNRPFNALGFAACLLFLTPIFFANDQKNGLPESREHAKRGDFDTNIVLPEADIQIFEGETVLFEAMVVGAQTAGFFWELTLENSGNEPAHFQGQTFQLPFPQAGTYLMTCAAEVGQSRDETPASRRITVLTEGAPETVITQPETNLDITLGEQVPFEASIVNGDPNSVTYFWEILQPNGQTVPAQGRQLLIQFNGVGDFTISCAAEDQQGVRDPTPAVRIITVTDVPDTVILLPTGDITLTQGESAQFLASGASAGSNNNLTFHWQLVPQDGSGQVQEFQGRNIDLEFNQPGLFTIFCAAENESGLRDPTPASRNIQVNREPPDTTIVQPEGNPSIMTGDSVFFSAVGTQQGNEGNFTFHWDLQPAEGNGEVQSFQDNDFLVDFPTAGVFLMSCTAEDSEGNRDPTPATRLIVVTEDLNPPETQITDPATDLEIVQGDTVSFTATATPTKTDTFTFNWLVTGALNDPTDVPREFQGAQVEIPFEKAGFFVVACSAVSARGIADPTPARRFIQVLRRNDVETTITTPQRDPVVPMGTILPFSATASPDGSFDSFLWEVFRSGANTQIQTFTGPAVLIDFPETGLYRIRCSATLNGQVVDETPDTRRVVVIEGVFAKIIQPQSLITTIAKGETVDFQGEVLGQEDGQQPEWYLQQNPNNRVQGLAFSQTFNETGTFTVIFELQGQNGDVASDQRVIRVLDQEPLSVRIVSPSDGAAMETGSSFDLVGETGGQLNESDRLVWLLNGVIYQGLTVESISLNEPGDYTLVLVLLDSQNERRAVDQIQIQIFDSMRPLEARIVRPLRDLQIVPGDSVFFAGKVFGGRNEPLTGKWEVYLEEDLILSQPELGNITFENAGNYQVRFQAFSDTRASNVAVRNLKVDMELPPSEDGIIPVMPGSYENVPIQDGMVFSFSLNEPVQNLAVDVQTEGPLAYELARINGSQSETLREGVIEGGENVVLMQIPSDDYMLTLFPAETKGKRDFSFSFGISVLLPTLYFPDITENGSATTLLGVVNPNGADAEVELIAYDAQGAILNQVAKTIKPMGKLEGTITSFFGDQADQVAWVGTNADLALTGFSFTETNDALESHAVSAATHLNAKLFAPHIAQDTTTWFTKANLINGSAEDTIAFLKTESTTTPLLNNTSFSKDGFDFLERFGGVFPEDAIWATMEEQDQKLAMAGTEVFGTVDGTRQTAGLALAEEGRDNPNFTYIANNVYFTHVARDVVTFWTGFAVVNVTEVDNNVKLTAYGPNGKRVGERTFTLGSLGKLTGSAASFIGEAGNPADVDWFSLEADGPIVGYTLFGTLDPTGKRLAGFEATSALRTELSFPYLLPSGGWHGISVVNISDTTANLDFRIVDDVGNTLQTETLQLGPREKLLTSLRDLFQMSDLPLNAAWVYCESDLPLAGFELFGDNSFEKMAALTAQ